MIRAALRRLWNDESGATAIEYALLAGIAGTIVASLVATGGAVTSMYSKVNGVSAALN